MQLQMSSRKHSTIYGSSKQKLCYRKTNFVLTEWWTEFEIKQKKSTGKLFWHFDTDDFTLTSRRSPFRLVKYTTKRNYLWPPCSDGNSRNSARSKVFESYIFNCQNGSGTQAKKTGTYFFFHLGLKRTIVVGFKQNLG